MLAKALHVPVDDLFEEMSPDEVSSPGEPSNVTAGLTPSSASTARTPSRAAAEAYERADRYLVRRSDRAILDVRGGVQWERLTPRTHGDVEFLELVYSPGAESDAQLYRHPGWELVVVLCGRLDIFVGFERYDLHPGDSMSFPSSKPHRYVNPSEETTRAVTVVLPDATEFDDARVPTA